MSNSETLQRVELEKNRYSHDVFEALQAENEALKEIVRRQAAEIRALDYRITTLLRFE